MALSLSWNHYLIRTATIIPSTAVYSQHQNKQGFSVSVRAQGGGEGGNVNRVWRRRKLKRKDRFGGGHQVPTLFLEERMNRIKYDDVHINHDINKIMLSAENRFEVVNEVIDEANKLLDKDPDAYGGRKKPVYHALTNRLNGEGYTRHEAYIEPSPFNIKRSDTTNGIIHQPFFL
ncbi:plastid transcriptionally active7 [Carex rostrata]